MFNEIEKLESEIIEFQSLVKESSVILKQLEKNVSDIRQIRLVLDENIAKIHLIEQNLAENIKNIQERKAEIINIDRRLKGILVLAILGILIGIGSIAMSLLA